LTIKRVKEVDFYKEEVDSKIRESTFLKRIKKAILGKRKATSKVRKDNFVVGWGNVDYPEYYLTPNYGGIYVTKETMQKYVDADKESQSQPIRVYGGRDDKTYYLYKRIVYKFNRADYSAVQILLLILDFGDKERRKFERLYNKFSSTEEPKKEAIKRTKLKNSDKRIVKRFNRTQIIKEIIKRDQEWYNHAKNEALIKFYTAYEKKHDAVIIDGKTDSS